MTDEDILVRIRQGEDSRTQFKQGPIGIAKLASELVAFANAVGGVILIGIRRVLELGATVDFVSDRELNVFKAILCPSPLVNPSVNGNLPVNLSEVLGYLVSNPTATYEEMARRFAKTRETIRVYINQLKNPPYSLLRRVGSAKKGHWEVRKI